MLKNNKGKLLLSSLVILLPALFGLAVWDRLPEQMATHWGMDGQVDGWSGRWLAVLVLPLSLLLGHWFCLFWTARDPKNRSQSRKIFDLVLWICPTVSLLAGGMIYSAALGMKWSVISICSLGMGVLFLAIGNYLPKCRQNNVIGIRIKWTLENEENWRATHRVSGKLWVAGGALFMACALLPDSVSVWAWLVLIVLLAVIPTAYSYHYYKKQVAEGAVFTPAPQSKANKLLSKFTLAVIAVVLAGTVFLLFTGEISLSCGEAAFTVKATYWPGQTVEYAAVDSVEYREAEQAGTRTYGLGSFRLLAGAFRNEDLGTYTRYSYTKCDACVLLRCGEKVLVIGGQDEESTWEIYALLSEKTGAAV